MNYNTVQDVINAGITNATILVNGTKYDDNTFTINNPPDWLKFNNLSATSIIASGNTFFGINSAVEHITFNRRDTAMYYLYSEEGTIGNYYKFYRLRWKGYSAYNYTSSSYLQEWEIIFVDTGDFMIHAVNIPTSLYNGTFTVNASETYAYTPPTTESPYVSFYSEDGSGSTFTIEYDILQLALTFKYLLKDQNNKYYTIVDNELQEISVSILTANTFQTYGLDDVPSVNLLLQLDGLEILIWKSEADRFSPGIGVNAVPNTQKLYSANYLFDDTDPQITGLRKFTADASQDVLFALSNDDGASWKKWDPSLIEWIAVENELDGMSIELFNSLTPEQLRKLIVDRQWKLYFILFENSYLNSIFIDYNY